jgi:hypothetical protein
MLARIEEARVYENGNVEIQTIPKFDLMFDMSELEGQDLADAIIIKDLMTAIIGRRLDQMEAMSGGLGTPEEDLIPNVATQADGTYTG